MKPPFLTALVLLAFGCSSERGSPIDSQAAPVNVAGKHTSTLTVMGLERELIVYVPDKAAGVANVPVVFMFHGTSGDGEKFFNISGWREKADAEGLIAVFPSSLTYCFKQDVDRDGVLEANEITVTTKWTEGHLGTATAPLCTPAELAGLSPANRALADHPLADDVAFVGAMIDHLQTIYSVDAKRIYASGFSNGGSFTSRLSFELTDRIAAISMASGNVRLPGTAARPLSVFYSVGNEDPGFAPTETTTLPLDETLFTTAPLLKSEIVLPMLAMQGLADQHTYKSGMFGGKKVTSHTFATSNSGAGNSFVFVVIEGLAHEYPNGMNSPLVAADFLWEFFKGETLP